MQAELKTLKLEIVRDLNVLKATMESAMATVQEVDDLTDLSKLLDRTRKLNATLDALCDQIVRKTDSSWGLVNTEVRERHRLFCRALDDRVSETKIRLKGLEDLTEATKLAMDNAITAIDAMWRIALLRTITILRDERMLTLNDLKASGISLVETAKTVAFDLIPMSGTLEKIAQSAFARAGIDPYESLWGSWTDQIRREKCFDKMSQAARKAEVTSRFTAFNLTYLDTASMLLDTLSTSNVENRNQNRF